MRPARNAPPVCAFIGAASRIGAAGAMHFARKDWRALINATPATAMLYARGVRHACLAARCAGRT